MIFRRPVFWLTLIFAGLMIAIPLHGNNVSMREYSSSLQKKQRRPSLRR